MTFKERSSLLSNQIMSHLIHLHHTLDIFLTNIDFVVTVLPKCKFMCLTNSEAKQYQNVMVWNREILLQDHASRWATQALTTPKFPDSFQQSPFLGKGKERFI